jgi:hypothetical protein
LLVINTQNCTFKSIKGIWKTIQRAVNKFHGCFKQIQLAG